MPTTVEGLGRCLLLIILGLSLGITVLRIINRRIHGPVPCNALLAEPYLPTGKNAMFDEIINELKEYGFNEKEAKNLLSCVKSESPEQLKIDAEKWIKHVFDVCEKEQLVRMVAMGFTHISYKENEMFVELNAGFKESPSAFLDS